jgi:hypothetical protein
MGFRRTDFGWKLVLGKDGFGYFPRYRLWWSGMCRILLLVSLHHLGLIGERCKGLIDIPFVVTELLLPSRQKCVFMPPEL